MHQIDETEDDGEKKKYAEDFVKRTQGKEDMHVLVATLNEKRTEQIFGMSATMQGRGLEHDKKGPCFQTTGISKHRNAVFSGLKVATCINRTSFIG